MSAVDKLLAVARAEIGYLEKASNAQLEDKTANAGSGNWTKYAAFFDANPGFYNGKKNGYAWCDVFVDWCHVQAFGIDTAKRLLCQPSNSMGAGVGYSRQYFMSAGRLHDRPMLGAQVFFGTQHTGIVSAVDGNTFRAIEGNTSSAPGVVANGGGVWEKSYTVNASMTFGWQDWNIVEDTVSVQVPTLQQGSIGDSVKALQALLNLWREYGLTVDGDFGKRTAAAVRDFQRKRSLSVDGIVGAQTWAALLQ